MSQVSHWRWRLDKMFLKINGERRYRVPAWSCALSRVGTGSSSRRNPSTRSCSHPPRRAAIDAANPGIDLRILASDRIANFQMDAVDLAVRFGRPPFGPGLTAGLLFEQIIIAVASPQVAEGMKFRLNGLTLLHDSHDLWPQFLGLAFPDGAPPVQKNTRFNQTALAIDAAIAGQGLALAGRFFVADDLASGKLVQVLGAELQTGSDFYLVAPRKPKNPAPVDAVRAWLAEQAGAIGRRGSP